MSQLVPINLHLHQKQGLAFHTRATEVLWGGAAGGGKSFLMRAASIIWCSEIPGLQVYLFRRIQDDLVKNHMEGPKGYRSLLAPWVNAGFVTIIEDEIKFWNGSKIFLCHVKDEKHRFKYLGAEIHVLLIDELTTFSEVIYRFLRNRVRAVGLNLPDKYKGLFPRIMCGSNPGNIGHHWVKTTFIDPAQEYDIYRAAKSEGGMLRQFIPAKLEDNPSMMTDDPGYEDRLSGLGSESLVKAMRNGDWDVVEGAFFTEFDRDRHVLRPVQLPEYWMRFRAMDYGYAAPFCVLWFAMATEDWQHPTERTIVPRGALVCYREWYGANSPNVGIKITAAAIAKGIKEREALDRVEDVASVIDPSAFNHNGGPSVAESMYQEGVVFRRADNSRVAKTGAIGGWDAVRARLAGDDDGRPMLFFFSTCKDTIRTLPALQHDTLRPEDLDTHMEDHAADTVRYACMSRPWTKPRPISLEEKLSRPLTTEAIAAWNEIQERRKADRL